MEIRLYFAIIVATVCNLTVTHSIKVYRINVLDCFCGSLWSVETHLFEKQACGYEPNHTAGPVWFMYGM